MTYQERQKVFKLRCASKRGETISEEDHKFLMKMWEKYPEEYKNMEREVFYATAPFGSFQQENEK